MRASKYAGMAAWTIGVMFIIFAYTGCQDGYFRARIFDLERITGPQVGPALTEISQLLHGLFLLARAGVGVAFAILGTLLYKTQEAPHDPA
jgi:hypothetical protein